jgi:hypothetical protein
MRDSAESLAPSGGISHGDGDSLAFLGRQQGCDEVNAGDLAQLTAKGRCQRAVREVHASAQVEFQTQRRAGYCPALERIEMVLRLSQVHPPQEAGAGRARISPRRKECDMKRLRRDGAGTQH